MPKGRHLSEAPPASLSRRTLAALALAAAALTRAPAQDATTAGPDPLASALPSEAPKSLFSASLGKAGEADAELYVKGTWSADLIGSLVLQKAESSGSFQLASATPILFAQEPDLFLSFLLYKKIFIEAKVTGEVGQARFAAGYRGGEDELLKEARIGNDGISFPALPFLSFGDGSYRSFGAAARIEAGDFSGRAMVRYDQADRVTKKFVGGSEVIETAIAPNAYVAGRFFATRVAPGGPVSLYVESASGEIGGSDGKAYRKLGPGEYSFSSATGFLSLGSAAKTRVLALYPGSGVDPVPENNVALTGVGICDLLFEPPPQASTGSLDPKLQVLCRYAATADPERADAYVIDAASGQKDGRYSARIDPSGFVEVLRDDTTLTMVAADRDVYRRPFEAAMGWLYATDYSDPKMLATAPVFSHMIVVRTFSTASSISIDKDLVAGSVELRRNGVQDFAFTIDAEKGVIELASPPGLAEEIEVSYMKESAERRTGILSAALGGFWELGEAWSAWAALGTNWSVPGTSFAADGATSPGRVSLTGGEKFSKGKLAHEAAVAATYSRDDATGRYRIEGMESSGSYVSTFMPEAGTTGYSIAETKDADLENNFPGLLRELHRDGSSQQALRIEAGAAPSAPAAFEKIVSLPPFESFKEFSFFARLPTAASLSLRIDDGSATTAMGVSGIPGASFSGRWTRFVVRYGSGDLRVFSQASEGAPLVLVALATAEYEALARCSRAVVGLSGLATGDIAWIDEICLEDSVGRASALFKGSVSYDDSGSTRSREVLPFISGIKASADTYGGVSDASFVSGGASLEASVGFVGIGIHARGTAAEGEEPTLRGGHELELPSLPFPVGLSDSFDFDPANGSFGRKDRLSLGAGRIASATIAQRTSWTPPAYLVGEGLLAQEWSGSLSLADSTLSIGIEASNRSLPPAGASPLVSTSYFESWIGSFAYALPALEAFSERRSIGASISARARGGSSDLLALSVKAVAEPLAAEGGLRRGSSSMRVNAPLSFKAFSVMPYYARSWKDRRSGAGSGILDDAALAMSDLASAPVYYAGIPFVELASASSAADFADQTSGAAAGVAQAQLANELGCSLSREFGSRWQDLVLPSAIAVAFRRELAREGDQVTDAAVWEASGKWASVNLFGQLGAYPSSLPFDSDEYAAMLKASIASPRGGGAVKASIQSQFLATLYAGAADRLDFDNRFALDSGPGSGSWSESAKVTLSKRVKRHFLLDLYRLILPADAAERAKPAGESARASVASRYLEVLAGTEPVARSVLTFSGEIDGLSGDASGRRLGWKASESYEARVTVPELATLKASASLSQALDAASGTLSLGFELSLGATISF